MNERQRKILADAFLTLLAGARRGARLNHEGATPDVLREHAKQLEALAHGIVDGLDRHVGASNVLDLGEKRRAKPLSSLRRT